MAVNFHTSTVRSDAQILLDCGIIPQAQNPLMSFKLAYIKQSVAHKVICFGWVLDVGCGDRPKWENEFKSYKEVRKVNL